MTAAEDYAACHDAIAAQRDRIYGTDRPTDPWTGEIARLFRFDPAGTWNPTWRSSPPTSSPTMC